MEPNELPFYPHHQGAPSDAPLKIFQPLVRLVQTKHLSCVEITLFLNGPKHPSTWSTSRRNIIGCVQNDFRAYGMSGANCARILCQD
jgi:hypothetical protein